MSDSDNSDGSNKREAMIDVLKDRLHTLENPVKIEVKKIVSDENRDKFYDNMHKFDRCDIISAFEKKTGSQSSELVQQSVSLIHSGLDSSKFDFVGVTDEKRKNQHLLVEGYFSLMYFLPIGEQLEA